jgi:hypothetical protein
MNILSLLFLTVIIIASSLGIFIKRDNDQPRIDATATADIRSQNSDISSYIAGQKQGDLLVYDPLSNTKTSWASRDSLGACDIVSLSKALRVTTTPVIIKPTPAATASASGVSVPLPGGTFQSEERFHSCTADYNLFSGSSSSPTETPSPVSLPNNVIIEVQVRFDKSTSIGGIIFSQVASDQSEKSFVFSLSPDGKYSFCLFDSLNDTCIDPHDGTFNATFKRVSEGYNRIAVVISGNVCRLYLNEQPLLQEGIRLEQNSVSQVVPIRNVGVVAGVVPSVEEHSQNEHVELWYRNLKIWEA